MNRNINKVFYQYVLPSMLAFALSGVYAIADGFFVGNALGDDALAAINIAYPLTAFIQAVGTGIGMAGAIQFSIFTGANKPEKSRRYFGSSILFLLFSGIVITVSFLLSSRLLLSLFGASSDILTLGIEYIRFVTYGAVFQVLATGFVPFIRNMGSSVTAMISMVCGFLTNIVLDYLFVWVLPLGMKGAAIATVIGQSVTFLICLLFIIKSGNFPLFPFEEGLLKYLKKIFLVSFSPFGLTFSPNIALILVNKNASVYGGDKAITCYAAISYLSAVILLLLQGISDGCQPLLSLSYGEGKIKKVLHYRNYAYKFSLFVALLSAALMFLARNHVAALFGASPEVTKEVASILPIFLIGYLFASYSRITTSYFYATEKNGFAYLLIYGEPLILCLALMAFPKFIGIWGTWISVPFSQICIMLLSAFFILRKKEHRHG